MIYSSTNISNRRCPSFTKLRSSPPMWRIHSFEFISTLSREDLNFSQTMASHYPVCHALSVDCALFLLTYGISWNWVASAAEQSNESRCFSYQNFGSTGNSIANSLSIFCIAPLRNPPNLHGSWLHSQTCQTKVDKHAHNRSCCNRWH